MPKLPPSLLLLMLAGALPAAAAENPPAPPAESLDDLRSQYTDLDLNLCTIEVADDMGSRWSCSGYRGIPVMVAEGDLRMFVSYGLKSTEERGAEQTLPPFNAVGPTLEWRLASEAGGMRVKATILRWFTGAEKPFGEVLVVTQVKPGATCQIAYIDALAVPDANALARRIADERAGSFDCTHDPEIIQPFRAF